MECRRKLGRSKKEKKDGTSRMQENVSRRKQENEELSNAFPNFMALTQEEKLAFFEVLSAARQSIEKTNTPIRGTFGTVHDEYLKYFSTLKEAEERGEEETEEEVEEDEETRRQKHCNTVDNNVSSTKTYCVSVAPCSTDSNLQTSLKPETLGCKKCKVPSEDDCNNCSLDNSEKTESIIDLKSLKQQCESIIIKERDKIVDLFVNKKKKQKEESWLETSCEDLEIMDSLEEDDFWEEFPKIDSKKIKSKRIEIAMPISTKLIRKPRFDALDAEERDIFFSTLREAHKNILEKNPDKKDEIIPLDVVLRNYEDSDEREITEVYSVSKPTTTKYGKNLKVKMTVKSTDNERLKKELAESMANSVDLEEKLEEDIFNQTRAESIKYREKTPKLNTTKKEEEEEDLLEDSKFKVLPKDSLHEAKKNLSRQTKSNTDLHRTKSGTFVPLKLTKKDKKKKKEEEEKSKEEEIEKKKKEEEKKKKEQSKKKEENEKEKQKMEEEKKIQKEVKKEEKKKRKQKEKDGKKMNWQNVNEVDIVTIKKEKEYDPKDLTEKKDSSLFFAEKTKEDESTSDVLKDSKIMKDKDFAEIKYLKREIPMSVGVLGILNDLKINHGENLKEVETIETIHEEMETRKEFTLEDYKQKKGNKPKEETIFTVASKEEESNILRSERHSVESKLKMIEDLKSDFQKGDRSQSTIELIEEVKKEPKIEGNDIVMEAKLEDTKIESVTETRSTPLEEENAIKEQTQIRKVKSGEQPKTKKSTSSREEYKYVRKEKSYEQNTMEKFEELENVKEQPKMVKSRGNNKAEKENLSLLEAMELISKASINTIKLDSKQTPQDGMQPAIVEANVAQVSEMDEKNFVEDKPEDTQKTKNLSQYKTGKVVLMDDETIDKIKDLIHDLEVKAKSEGNHVENEYLYLLLGYIDYLSNVLESLLLQKKNFKTSEHRPSTSQTMETHHLTFEETRKPKKQLKPKIPRSISDQDLTDNPQFVFPDGEDKRDRRRWEVEAEEDDKTIAPKGGLLRISDSDSDSNIDVEEAIEHQGIIATRKKAYPNTRIRLLQDLLKERAQFVEGSIDDFKIIRLPEPEYVPTEKKSVFAELQDIEEEQSEKGTKVKFFRTLANLCRCGKKVFLEEDEVLENLKGEAVAVDASVNRTRNAASATLNESTMNVLKAADRRKMIQKYWKKV